jgi:hypothetical protein
MVDNTCGDLGIGKAQPPLYSGIAQRNELHRIPPTPILAKEEMQDQVCAEICPIPHPDSPLERVRRLDDLLDHYVGGNGATEGSITLALRDQVKPL